MTAVVREIEPGAGCSAGTADGHEIDPNAGFDRLWSARSSLTPAVAAAVREIERCAGRDRRWSTRSTMTPAVTADGPRDRALRRPRLDVVREFEHDAGCDRRWSRDRP